MDHTLELKTFCIALSIKFMEGIILLLEGNDAKKS